MAEQKRLFLEDYQEASDLSDDEFRVMFGRALAAMNWSTREAAVFLDLAVPTMKRWLEGTTVPHRLMRPVLLQKLVDVVRETDAENL